VIGFFAAASVEPIDNQHATRPIFLPRTSWSQKHTRPQRPQASLGL
jgi:hypothetical protein